MIFVTVGTHEQQFNRLLKEMDRLVKNKIINEEVFIQTGYSDYKPKYCKSSKFLSYKEMDTKVKEARIVITHGGPASFIAPLQIGKTPIVVPRQLEFGEHVNNHQLEFANQVSKRMGTIIVVSDISELGDLIKNYDSLVKEKNKNKKSNNKQFCEKFEEIVDKIL